MSVLTNSKNKRHVGTIDDSVYLKPLANSCWLCVYRGRKQVFKNLWQLHYHLIFHHKNENYKPIEEQLYNLIKLGVLR